MKTIWWSSYHNLSKLNIFAFCTVVDIIDKKTDLRSRFLLLSKLHVPPSRLNFPLYDDVIKKKMRPLLFISFLVQSSNHHYPTLGESITSWSMKFPSRHLWGASDPRVPFSHHKWIRKHQTNVSFFPHRHQKLSSQFFCRKTQNFPLIASTSSVEKIFKKGIMAD